MVCDTATDDSKTKQITEAEFPRDADTLNQWLGLVQWCSQNIHRCALTLAPLHARKKALTDKGGFDYEPTEEELASFAEIKEWISDPEKGVLALPDFESPFYLLCDAANTVGMGVIVAQWREGRMRTVAYYSRQWKTAESRWHSLEHECCTANLCLSLFHQVQDTPD